jgi:integrase
VIYKRGKKYWYQFQVNGQRIRASAKTANKHVALQVEAEKRLAFQANSAENRRQGNFEDAFTEFIAWSALHVKPKTRQRYQVSGSRLKKHFGRKTLDSIRTTDVEDFKSLRLGECSVAGTNRDLAALRTFWNWCGRMDYRVGSCRVKLLPEGPGKMRIVSYDEERAYLGQADDLLRDVATMIVETGMRPGELFAVQREDVNLEARYIYIPAGKTHFARRTIPLTDRALEAIERRLPSPARNGAVGGESDRNLLFPGKAIAQVVMRRHKALCKRLGLNVRLYDFRHTYGTRMAMAGVDLMTLRELMGHSSITITQRYCHPTPEHKRRAVAQLENYNSHKKATLEEVKEETADRNVLMAERGGFEPPIQLLTV